MVLAAAVLLGGRPARRAAVPRHLGRRARRDRGRRFVGSLIGVLFLIAVPIVMLGTCSPWAIRLAVPDVEHAGRVAGRLYAISTVGLAARARCSAALVLIPFIGTQRTFLVFALVIALVAAAGLGWRFAAVPVALAAAIALPVGTVKATNDGEVIFETETENQYVRVVEEDDGDRLLELNEGQAVHSLYRPGTYLTGDVWDGYLVLPFAGARRAPGADRDPRQRRRDDRPRLRPLLSRRPRSTGSRSTPSSRRSGSRYLRHGLGPEPDRPQRGRPALAAALRRRLRRDHGRRLPPALHPVLPGHARSSSSSSATGWRRAAS